MTPLNRCPVGHTMRAMAYGWFICPVCGELTPGPDDDPALCVAGTAQWKRRKNRVAMLSMLARMMLDGYMRVAQGGRPDTERARALVSEYERSWGLKRSHWAGEVTRRSAPLVTFEDLRSLRALRDLVGAFERIEAQDAHLLEDEPARARTEDLFRGLAQLLTAIGAR